MVYDTNAHGKWYGSVQSYVYYYANDRDFPWGVNLYSVDYSTDEGRNAALAKLMSVGYLYVLETNDAFDEFVRPLHNDQPLEGGRVYAVSHDGGTPQISDVA